MINHEITYDAGIQGHLCPRCPRNAPPFRRSGVPASNAHSMRFLNETYAALPALQPITEIRPVPFIDTICVTLTSPVLKVSA